LKKYLSYAKEVSAGKFVPTNIPSKTHNVEWYLKYKLSEQTTMGYSLISEMPFAILLSKRERRHWDYC
jgi:hypothetical protein